MVTEASPPCSRHVPWTSHLLPSPTSIPQLNSGADPEPEVETKRKQRQNYFACRNFSPTILCSNCKSPLTCCYHTFSDNYFYNCYIQRCKLLDVNRLYTYIRNVRMSPSSGTPGVVFFSLQLKKITFTFLKKKLKREKESPY